MTEKQDYTPKEFAKLVKRHYNTVYNWLVKGIIPSYKLGGRWLIPHNALEQIKGEDVQSKSSNIKMPPL